MEIYVLPTDAISPVTRNTYFSLPCKIKSRFVLIERNDSAAGDLGDAITIVFKLELVSMKGICPIIGNLVVFSISLRSKILVLKKSLNRIYATGIRSPMTNATR